jgi:hypothetical protein
LHKFRTLNYIYTVHLQKQGTSEAALLKLQLNAWPRLEEAPKIECAYSIGKQTAENRCILVKDYNQQDQHAIMSNGRMLKGTKIVIIDDLTPEEQAMRRTILSAARAAREKTKVRRTGLLVNGVLQSRGRAEQ